MARNTPHEMLTPPSVETAARQRFVLAFKKETERLRRETRSIYEARIKDTIAGDATDKDAIVSALYKDDIYQTFSALKYIGQKRMWGAITRSLNENRERLSADFERFATSPDRLGSLELDSSVRIPQEFKAVHVHLQPGGYLADNGDKDVLAGAYYEEGGALYSQGQGVGTRESKAECLLRFIRRWKPGFEPSRILDMACSAGASSVPYAEAYPDADMHAIDIAPAMLRYAHARAESIGVKVHFHQDNVEKTKFENESFDLIVSHNAMHEMSSATQQAMITESYRLLKPGGLCLHQDLPLDYSKLDAFGKVQLTYDKWFNGELYWTDYGECDCRAMFENAGFTTAGGHFGPIDQVDESMKWYVAAAEKPFT